MAVFWLVATIRNVPGNTSSDVTKAEVCLNVVNMLSVFVSHATSHSTPWFRFRDLANGGNPPCLPSSGWWTLEGLATPSISLPASPRSTSPTARFLHLSHRNRSACAWAPASPCWLSPRGSLAVGTSAKLLWRNPSYKIKRAALHCLAAASECQALPHSDTQESVCHFSTPVSGFCHQTLKCYCASMYKWQAPPFPSANVQFSFYFSHFHLWLLLCSSLLVQEPPPHPPHRLCAHTAATCTFLSSISPFLCFP